MEELNLMDYVRVLLRWKWPIIVILVSSMVTSYIVSNHISPVYEASTTVLVREQKSAVDMPFLETLAGMGKNPVMNYVEILKSRTLMEYVVARLGWDISIPSPEFDSLQGSVKVQPVQGTDTIKVTVESTNPAKAMAVANTLIDIFIEQSQLANQEAARSAREFISEQLKVAEGKLARAEETLLSYKKSKKVFAPTEETKAQIEKLVALETLKAQTEVGIQEARAQLAEIQKELRLQDPTLVTSKTITDNPLIQQYKVKLAELEASLAGAREKYTEKHPTVLALKAEIEEVKGKLGREMAKIVSAETTALNPVHQGLLQELIQVQAQIVGLEAKKEAVGRVIAQNEASFAMLPQKELDITRLTREQRVAEEIYVMLLTKYEEMRISEAMKLADIQRIDRAVVPTNPVRPRKMLNIAIAGFLGLFVGVGLAFVLEYIDTSFKTPEEVERHLGIPLLGVIPSIEEEFRRTRRRRRKVKRGDVGAGQLPHA